MNVRLLLALLAWSASATVLIESVDGAARHTGRDAFGKFGGGGSTQEIPVHIQQALGNYRIATEARANPLRSHKAGTSAFSDGGVTSCSPTTVGVPSSTADAFYSALLARTPSEAGDDGPLRFPLRPPTFVGSHMRLCDPDGSNEPKRWDFCLPITTSLHSPSMECVRADRFRLLEALNSTSTTSTTPLCHTSVLHLLLEDVFAILQAQGARPALLFGSMLGAVRDHGIIPWTRDIDLGYQSNTFVVPQAAAELRARGYHVFKADVWRVCVAPTHPLASLLYDPSAGHHKRRHRHDTYVDLYAMAAARAEFHVEKTRNPHRAIPAAKVTPYSTTTVFGSYFETLADPVDFLTNEYGAMFMVPSTKN